MKFDACKHGSNHLLLPLLSKQVFDRTPKISTTFFNY